MKFPADRLQVGDIIEVPIVARDNGLKGVATGEVKSVGADHVTAWVTFDGRSGHCPVAFGQTVELKQIRLAS